MIHQDPLYHQFAATQTLLGVPNFWNVVSNIPFLIVAIYGLYKLHKSNVPQWSYLITLYGTMMVGIGSTFYHLHPSDSTLVWDRLPMAIVFMSMVATITHEKWLLPLLLFGIGSVIVWRFTGELLPYVIVQFGAILVILVVAGREMWIVTWLYILAKAFEMYDHQIALVLPNIGGHPLKHVTAALAMLAYIKMRGSHDQRHQSDHYESRGA